MVIYLNVSVDRILPADYPYPDSPFVCVSAIPLDVFSLVPVYASS